MGYTHYFKQVGPAPTKEQWVKIQKDIAPILGVNYKHGTIQRGSDNPNAPEISEDAIIFNGVEDDGHETFYLAKDQTGFEFCKTARKPYDGVVVSVLRVVKAIVPDWLELSSDGNGEQEHITPENPKGLVFP